MMLRTQNTTGSFIYPMYKFGELDAAHQDKKALTVFIPDSRGFAGDWACTIEGEHGAITLNTLEEVYRLITALEIAYEKVKIKDGLG
jgi:hypothetical protein